MKRTDLCFECRELAHIIDNLATGKESCEIGDTRYSLDDVLDFLRGYLQELKDLNERLAEHGNTPELLKEVHEKYTEPWLFQVSFTVQSLPRVIGGLLYYPNQNE